MLLLERVPIGFFHIAALERSRTSQLQQPKPDQLLRAFGIHCTPGARGLSRCKAYHVTVSVQRLSEPVDPAEAERLINRFRPGNARLAGPLLMKPHPEFRYRRIVLLQPLPKGGRCGEKGWFNRGLFAGFFWHGYYTSSFGVQYSILDIQVKELSVHGNIQ